MITVEQALARAVAEAQHAPISGPNPRVGAVVLRDGNIIGTGWHRGAGFPHAEAEALQDAARQGNSVAGATLVVTLEPCKHHGRTPPCTDLIAKAGIAEVIYSCHDPGDDSGGGAQILQAAGVKVSQHEYQPACELIRVWATAITKGRPYVIVKIAASLDGRIAAADGTSQWITGPESRDHAHRVRSEVDAILVTTGTVLADNPALTARNPTGELAPQQPLRVIVGERPIPPDAKIWQPAHGVGAVQFKTHDINQVLAALAEREIRQVLIEGGPAIITECLKAGVVDEVQAYLAPVVLGAGPNAVGDYGAATLAQAARFHTIKVVQLGQDAMLIARPE